MLHLTPRGMLDHICLCGECGPGGSCGVRALLCLWIRWDASWCRDQIGFTCSAKCARAELKFEFDVILDWDSTLKVRIRDWTSQVSSRFDPAVVWTS